MRGKNYWRNSRRVIGLGTYCGYALVWIAGPNSGERRTYEAEKVYGIDIDVEVTQKARANFQRLSHVDHVELLAEDGLEAVKRLEGPFDYVYLDVEGRDAGKGLYVELLQRLYDKVERGAWVLAHDVVVPSFAGELAEYLSFVRNPTYFAESILLDVDAFGLELSVK